MQRAAICLLFASISSTLWETLALLPLDVKNLPIIKPCHTKLRYKAVPAEPVDFSDIFAGTYAGGESECAEACYMKVPNCKTAMFYPQMGRCRFSDQRYPCDTPTSVEGPSFFRTGHMMLHCFWCHATLLRSENSVEEFAQLLRNNDTLNDRRMNSSVELADDFDFPPFVITRGEPQEDGPPIDVLPDSDSIENTANDVGGSEKDVIPIAEGERSDRPRFIFGSQIDLIKLFPKINDSLPRENRIPFQLAGSDTPGTLNNDPGPASVAVPQQHTDRKQIDRGGLPEMIREILPELRDAIEDVLMNRGYVFVRAVLEGPVSDTSGQPSVLATFAAPRDFPLAAIIREEPIPVIQFPKLEISTDENNQFRIEDAVAQQNSSNIAGEKRPKFVRFGKSGSGETISKETVAMHQRDSQHLRRPQAAAFVAPKTLKLPPAEKHNSSFHTAKASDRSIITEGYNESSYVGVVSTTDTTLPTDFEAAKPNHVTSTLSSRSDPDAVFFASDTKPQKLPFFRALSAPPPSKVMFSISNLINETSLASEEIRSLVIGPPDPPEMPPILSQAEPECPTSLLLPCSYGVGRGCRLSVSSDGCRVCRCPFRSPARGCFGSIFMSEQVRQGLLYQERACSDSEKKAQSVIRWYRKVTSHHNTDECVAVQYPYCDSSEDRVHRMPRTREECEFFCYRADAELVRQLHFYRSRI